MGKEKFMNDHNTALHLKREERLKDLLEIIINSPNGMSAKEMAAALKTSADSARLYIKDLLARNLIAISHKEGKTRIYKAVDPASVKPIEEQPVKLDVRVVETPKEDPMPIGHGGKEFEPGSYIPCGNTCKPGDVVWVSSRSGEGAFFRYLVITPWEYKAMVLGIFEEGYPKLNLNDPYYVYIGDDPEKGVKLYADLRNTCQRGYRQFGERVMHVDQDLFDDVKGRLARSMGISCKKIDPDVVRLLKDQLDKAKAAVNAISKDRDDIRGAFEKSGAELKAAHEQNSDLHKQLLDLSLDRASLQERNDNQAETIKELKERNADLEKAVNDLDDQLEKYEAATPAAPQQAAVFDNELFTGMVIDSKVKETKIEMLEEQVKMLRQMVFNMIKGGGAA